MAVSGEGPLARLDEARRQHPALDRVIRTQEHYGAVQGSQQAGAVTYFGFLSVFPILALAVFVVGWVAKVYPEAQEYLTEAINEVMPGLVGEQEGQLSLDAVERFQGLAAVFGVLGVLYAGLGWLSSLRSALVVVFQLPEKDRPNFVVGKLRDLMTLAFLGITLFVAVAVTGFISGFSETVLGWVGLSDDLGWLVTLLSIVLGLAANAVLFYAVFVLLAEPRTPRPSLWQGAVLGAVGFEVLKQLSGLLLASTRGQPAFQAFGIALILLVWINYFSRVLLYAASFAHVSPAARAQRERENAPAPVQGPHLPPLDLDPENGRATPRTPAAVAGSPLAAFLSGVAGTIAAMAVARAAARDARRRG